MHLQLLLILDIRGHAAAVIGINRFGDHRVTDTLRGAHGAAQSIYHGLARHRQTEVAEDAVGFVFLPCQLHCDVHTYGSVASGKLSWSS